MSYIDVTGKTVEEAIGKALVQLGMDRDDVSVEILEQAKSGFLGMGAKPARVRVTYGPDEAPMEEIIAPVKPVVAEKPAAPEKTEKVEKPREKRPQQPRAAKPQQQPKPRQEKREEQEVVPAAPAETLPESQDDNAQRITAFLTGLLEHMNSAAEVKVYEEEKGRYKVILEGQKLGALIGRRGETLDALQYLTSLKVNRGQEGYTRVTLDTENYRAKREDTLIRLANRMANRAVKTGRKVSLEPMNPYERRIIHSALQANEAVDTHSEGDEPNRHVVITLRK